MKLISTLLRFDRCQVVAVVLLNSLMTTFVVGQNAKPAYKFHEPGHVIDILDNSCIDCHDDSMQKGGIRLDVIGELDPKDRLDLLNKISEQVYFGLMPPKKEDKLAEPEKNQIIKWATKELDHHGANELDEKVEKFKYANYVNHDDLFSGKYAHLKPFTYDRSWLVSSMIFSENIQRIFAESSEDDRKRRWHSKDINNPFILPDRSGVRYYANTSLGAEHFNTMIQNAEIISKKLTTPDILENETRLPALSAMFAGDVNHENSLEEKEQFMKDFMGEILKRIYSKEANQALLPRIERLPLKTKKYTQKQKEKATEAIFKNLVQYVDRSKSYDELVDHYERHLIYEGVQPANIIHHHLCRLYQHKDYYLSELAKLENDPKRTAEYMPKKYVPLAPEDMKLIANAIRQVRQKGDTYKQITGRAVILLQKEFESRPDILSSKDLQLVGDLVNELFVLFYDREAEAEERAEFGDLFKKFAGFSGKKEGVRQLIKVLVLRTEFIRREEFGVGKADEHGRRMLSPRDGSIALAYALTDLPPDAELKQAVASGKLSTKQDYEREVRRMLKIQLKRFNKGQVLDNIILPSRKTRFFRDFFGYEKAVSVFKDDHRFGAFHKGSKGQLVNSANLLLKHILVKDTRVIESLLDTEDFFMLHTGSLYNLPPGTGTRIHPILLL